ncbi:protein BLISTER isoform X2 [Wolffia australiana]
MSSAQLLQNSSAGTATTVRKQGHLEAGKKRLEEFRKKKAEGKAKKASSTGQLQSSDVNNLDRFSEDQFIPNADIVSRTELSTTASGSEIAMKLYPSNRDGSPDIAIKTVEVGDAGMESNRGFELTRLMDDYYSQEKSKSSLPLNESVDPQRNSKASVSVVSTLDTKDFGRSALVEQDKFEIFSSNSFSKTVSISNTSLEETVLPSYEDATTLQLHRSASNENDIQRSNSSLKSSDLTRQPQSSLDSASTFKRPALPPSSSSTSFPTTSGRSRPSFHDFINVPRASPSSSLSSFSQPDKDESAISFSSQRFSIPDGRLLPSQKSDGLYFKGASLVDSMNPKDIKDPFLDNLSSSSTNTGMQDIVDGGITKSPDFSSSTKDEDFSVLEQHIEDLTQEKFSLQRALESSRSLAESLASENSSLTENYNQQRKMINELKLQMEHMQEEIRVHLVAVEAAKMESANALLECSAADERAKILASEVIGLEDKALRLRSNELKLEKQLESLNTEIGSYKRKLSSLEKERNDFQSTIEALQEEKKLLLSKVRKTALNERVDAPRASSPKKDAFTSTDDSDARDGDNSMGTASIFDVGSSPARESNGNFAENISSSQFSSESGRTFVADLPSVIPLEQQRMVANINSLISELALEKEELLQKLRAKSADNSKLMDANKDLSQKLERQTQRLEFIASQQMASEAVLQRPVQAQNLPETTAYTDEGDEVVERVLGWIMKLFPGGPSKRRTSKLL